MVWSWADCFWAFWECFSGNAYPQFIASWVRIICIHLSCAATTPNDRLSASPLIVITTAILCPEHPRYPSSPRKAYQRKARLTMSVCFFRLSSSSPPVIRPSILGTIFRCPSSIYPPDCLISLPLCSISSWSSSSSAEISVCPRNLFWHLPVQCPLNTSTPPT